MNHGKIYERVNGYLYRCNGEQHTKMDKNGNYISMPCDKVVCVSIEEIEKRVLNCNPDSYRNLK